ncbi:MAG TPA: hypothetical protein VGK32_03845 [Vicinamibacterales bacterium]
MLKGLRQTRDLLPVEIRHQGMQQRRRLAAGGQLPFDLVASGADRDQPVLHFPDRHALHDRLDDLRAARLESLEFALERGHLRAVLHDEPVHLPGELVAELLEQLLAEELLGKRLEHSLLDLVAPNRQVVRARPSRRGPEAAEAVAGDGDVTGAAFAAASEVREQVAGTP